MYRIGQLRKFKPRIEMYRKLRRYSTDSSLYFRFRSLYEFRDTKYNENTYFYIIECDNVSERVYNHHLTFDEDPHCGCGICKGVRMNKPPRLEYRVKILGHNKIDIDDLDQLTLWYFTEEVIC